MVGDHHIEVRRAGGRVEVFVSDAWRRPIRPASVGARFDGGDVVALRSEAGRFVAEDLPGAAEIEVAVSLSARETLSTTFDFGG